MSDKQKSHLGLGLIVGAVIGLASASFLNSKKGKSLAKDLKHRTAALQKKVLSELRKGEEMTQKRYKELVDSVVAYYATSKEIAKTEIPTVKKSLLATWKTVQKELKSVKK
ncbi:MAG: YtxH domain-containing protein [Patescibacteria group bacterium]